MYQVGDSSYKVLLVVVLVSHDGDVIDREITCTSEQCRPYKLSL